MSVLRMSLCCPGETYIWHTPEPIKEKQMKRTRADLFREYARVIDMCEGTKVEPKSCVRFDGGHILTFNDPTFFGDPDLYKFAIAIVEDRPVFEGDELYSCHGNKFIAKEVIEGCKFLVRIEGALGVKTFIKDCTWNPPKPKTITLTDMPMPVGRAGYKKVKPTPTSPDQYDLILTFDSIEEREMWRNAINNQQGEHQ